MRRFTHMLLLVSAVAMTAAPLRADGQMTWERDLGKASETARKSNRPMLLEFWSVTCEPCKVLDETVFPDERVGAAFKNLHAVRVDVDKQPDVARKYNVNGTPTLLLTDSYGTELFRYTGLLPADRMLQLINELPADVARFNELSAALTRNKDDVDALVALGRELRAQSFYRASNRYFDRALKARSNVSQKNIRADLLIGMGRNYFELKEYPRSADMFEHYLREFPGGPSEPEVMLGLGWALQAQNKTQEARRVFQSLTEKHKGTRAAADAAALIKQP
ncbi:MAG: thioredoxin fold domain-containing protein [Vicinamibacterales bacterium]